MTGEQPGFQAGIYGTVQPPPVQPVYSGVGITSGMYDPFSGQAGQLRASGAGGVSMPSLSSEFFQSAEQSVRDSAIPKSGGYEQQFQGSTQYFGSAIPKHFGKTVKFYEFWCFMKIPEISYQKYRSRHFWTYLFGKRSKTPHPRPLGSRQCFQDIAQQWDESSESSRCVGPLQLCGGV